METGKAIYKLLKDSSEGCAICADRIYPELAQQDAALPFIVYTVTDTTPAATKNATSKLDTARVELYCVSDDYEVGMNLGIAVRGALDRQSGTLSGVEVQSIDFDTSDVQFDPDQRVYVLEQTYDVRIQRTGTAVSVAQFPSNAINVSDNDSSGAVTSLVFSNNTVTIDGNTATIISGGGGGSLTVQETSAADSATATTLEFPANSVTHAASKATISLLQGLAAEYAGEAGAGAIFANGLLGDINQDGSVTTTDLLALLGNFGQTASPTSSQLTQSLARAQTQITDGSTAFFSNSRIGAAQASVTALTNAGHTIEYFEGVNGVQGRGFISNFLADTVADNTVRRTLYISGTPFPTALSQMQAYALGPYDNIAQATVQAVVNAYINSITSNGSIAVVRTLVSSTPDKLLDTYTGAAAAYSVRLLDKDYTGSCMRIRRDSDDSEADIGFDSSGDLDTSAIATHCGSANGYVVTWYDQANVGGTVNNATQTTSGNQPQIYNGSAVITEGSKPALDHDGSRWLTLGVSDLSNTNLFAESSDPFAVMCVAKYDDTGGIGGGTIFSKATSTGHLRTLQIAHIGPDFISTRFRGSETKIVQPSDLHIIQEAHWSGSAALAVVNGTETSATVGSASENSDNINIGSRTNGGFILNGKTQEIIVWGNAQDSTNRAAIRTSMNNYFSIY